MPVEITKENFKNEVLESTMPVLIDFWAPWCGPCRMMSPVIDEIAVERTDIKVGKCNVDEQMEIAGMMHVMSIPTLVLFRNGRPEGRIVGARPKQDVLAFINQPQTTD